MVEHKIINNCLSDNFFEVKLLNVEIFCAFKGRPEVTNILATRDNVLHQKRIYLQKNESFIFKPNVQVFCNSPHIVYNRQN